VKIVVEVGGWEHECCGPSYERDSVVSISCLVIPGPQGAADRYVASRHGLATGHRTSEVRGRVVDLRIEHPDGSTEPIGRLPSGGALRGGDEEDDGHLEHPWTGDSVTRDSDRYFLTIGT
jgi:hypothetical protein